MAYGNLALDLILAGVHGRLVVLKNGRYDNVPIDVVTASKKVVNVKRHYNAERLRPQYRSFEMQPLFIMTGDGVEAVRRGGQTVRQVMAGGLPGGPRSDLVRGGRFSKKPRMIRTVSREELSRPAT